MKQGPIASNMAAAEHGAARLALIGTPIVFAAYAIALTIGHGGSLWDAAPGSAANTIPTVLFGLIAYRIVRSRLVGRPVAIQLAGHALLCAAYVFLAYWLLIVLLGAANGLSVIQFNVEPFPVRASVWQMLENATTYGIISALVELRSPK